ncbi:hypothetical protein CBS101457_001697 [Exobasidium rhododendri]|nr:hypothetical protein CBS101457_001697 [Exobasidium rhododendri]
MSGGTQVSSSTPASSAPIPASPSSSSSLHRDRPNLMNNLPPVFSPDPSPPMGVAFREKYLPLVSPAITEDDGPFNFNRRRGSTPGSTKGGASQYFHDLRKRRRTSECSPAPTSASTMSTLPSDVLDAAPVFVLQKGNSSTNNIAILPTSIAQPIREALEMQASMSSSPFTILKRRTMSLPSSYHADLSEVEDEEESTNAKRKSDRRASVRSHQLTILANQARLARTGASSFTSALRAERAVEGAFQDVVRFAQDSKSTFPGIKEKGDSVDTKMGEDKKAKLHNGADDDAGSSLQNPSKIWRSALSSPQTASAFLHSASEVAHDWANGFYAVGKEWAGDALQKEKRRLSENEIGRKRAREGEDEEEEREASSSTAAPIRPPSPKRTASEPSKKEGSPFHDSSPSGHPPSPRSSLVAAHKRLSTSLPSVPTLESSRSSGTGGEGGKLVDVLSNFVELIEQRKEGCHGLERLAQSARRLSTVQLPSVIVDSLMKRNDGEDEEDDDDDTE